MLFSDKYVALCAKTGKAITTVATDLGYSRTSGLNWAAGATPRKTTIKQIADYFGVTVEYLSNDEEKPPAPEGGGLSEKEWELIKLFRNAPVGYQDSAFHLLESAPPVEPVPGEDGSGG